MVAVYPLSWLSTSIGTLLTCPPNAKPKISMIIAGIISIIASVRLSLRICVRTLPATAPTRFAENALFLGIAIANLFLTQFQEDFFDGAGVVLGHEDVRLPLVD